MAGPLPAAGRPAAGGTPGGGVETCGNCGAAGEASADAVRAVLEWAARDVTRFVGLLKWLCVTAYRPRITLEGAEEELAGLGLGDPAFAPLRVLLAGLRSRADAAALAQGLRHGADVAREALRTLPADGAERPRVARFHAALLVQANVLVPGTMDFAEVDEAAVRPEHDPAAIAAWPGPVGPEQYVPEFVDSVRVAQTGDLDGLDRMAARLRQRIATMPAAGTTDAAAGEEAVTVLAQRDQIAMLAQTFAEAARLSGSLQDADAALAVFRDLRAAYDRDGSTPPPLLILAAAPQELALARRSPDPVAVLRRLIAELEALRATFPNGHELRWMAAGHLGDAQYELAVRSGDPAALRAAAQCAREVAGTDPRKVPLMMTASFPAVRAMALITLVLTEPDREAVECAVTEIHRTIAGAGVQIHQELGLRYALGRALLHAADRLGAPELLDQCIEELDRLGKVQRGLLRHEQVWPHIAESMALLSEALWKRGKHRPRTANATGSDLELALTARDVSLAMLPVHVMFQHRTEHRLTVARTGSAHAQWLAYWNLAVGRVPEAVSALERGRALVLRAASATHGLSERLTAAGRPDLAARQRELLEDLIGSPGAAAALLRPTSGPQFSTGVRGAMFRELKVGASARTMLEVPGTHDLAVGLLASGTEALVYLLPGPEPGMPGYALVLRPEPGGAPPAVLKLPLLTCDSSLLHKYLDAAAQRSRYATDPTVHESWQAAGEAHWRVMLDELCDWAWQAAMGEILTAVGAGGGTPRIVLVPCGPLGAVPWHAARTASAPGSAHRYHYACQDAVISYAPSGGQFLRATARRRMPADGLAVLVDDPELSLVWSDIETEALETGCYPGALRYGGGFAADGRACDAPGSPDDLLAVLPGGCVPAAVLHVACHGLAGPEPTRSALWLATPPGGERDAGRLTVTRILEGAAGAPPTAAFPEAGPLVVLSACETDLSTRDHDEALTLATALVTRGAADVVGTRWVVHGSETALMTAVIHHARTVRGLAPPDTLRAAQLWMLDPDRELPPAFDGILRREAARTDLHHPCHWAALTHQGNSSAATGDDEALSLVRWSLVTSRALDNRRGQAYALAGLGEVLWKERRFDEALAAYDAALAAWPDGEGHPDHRRLVAKWAATHNTWRLSHRPRTGQGRISM
jgi:hypothetical protein